MADHFALEYTTRPEASVLKPRQATPGSRRVVPTFGGVITENQYVILSKCVELVKSG